MAKKCGQREKKKHNEATQNLQCRQFPVPTSDGAGAGAPRVAKGVGVGLHSMRRCFGGVPLRSVALLWFCCGNKIHHNGIISGRTKRRAIHTHRQTRAHIYVSIITHTHTHRASNNNNTRKKGNENL